MLSAALMLTMAISVTGCGSEAKEENTAQTAQEAIEAAVDAAMGDTTEALKEENLGSNAGKDLSSIEKNYTFTLDGKEYHLSCQFQKMLDDGWAFSDGEVTMDGADVVTLNESVERGTQFDVVETPDFTLYKTVDGKEVPLMVGIYSDSTTKKILGEYRLGFLYVRDDMGLDLVMNTGITFGNTIEEVKEVYGEPVSESSEILCYQFGDADVAFMPERPEFLNFYVKEGKVYMISMQYFPVMSK